MDTNRLWPEREVPPVTTLHLAFLNQAKHPGDHHLLIRDHRAGTVPRHERAIGLIGSIGKSLCGARHPQFLRGADQVGIREAEQNQPAVHGRHTSGDRPGQIPILGCLIVEGAVRLHVPELGSY